MPLNVSFKALLDTLNRCQAEICLQHLVWTTLSLLQGALKSFLEPEDLHNMFGWLESLVKNPFSECDSSPVMPGA